MNNNDNFIQVDLLKAFFIQVDLLKAFGSTLGVTSITICVQRKT